MRSALANVCVRLCVCVAKHLIEWEFSSLSFATRRLRRNFSPVPRLAPTACAVLRGYSLGICFVGAVARATRLGRTEGTEVVKLTGICTRNESEKQRLDPEGRRGKVVRCSIDNFFVLPFVLFGAPSLSPSHCSLRLSLSVSLSAINFHMEQKLPTVCHRFNSWTGGGLCLRICCCMAVCVTNVCVCVCVCVTSAKNFINIFLFFAGTKCCRQHAPLASHATTHRHAHAHTYNDNSHAHAHNYAYAHNDTNNNNACEHRF